MQWCGISNIQRQREQYSRNEYLCRNSENVSAIARRKRTTFKCTSNTDRRSTRQNNAKRRNNTEKQPQYTVPCQKGTKEDSAHCVIPGFPVLILEQITQQARGRPGKSLKRTVANRTARGQRTPASHRAAACEKRRRDTKSCARCGNCSRWGKGTATSHGSMERVAWGPRWSMDTAGLPPAWSMVTLGCAVTPEGCVVT